MHRKQAIPKQKLSLKKYHTLARSNFPSSLSGKRRHIIRPRTLLIGLTATLGISSLAFAAGSDAFKPQPSSPSSSAAPLNSRQSAATVTVDNSSEDTESIEDTDVNTNEGSAQSNSDDTRVRINNENIPVKNGKDKVHRTFIDHNGTAHSVDISINSNSTNSNSSHSSTDISINSNSSSSSTTQNSTRGSPRR
jgi:hypothetical protein